MELVDSLNQLIKNPSHNHAHVSSEDCKQEITVCIYDLKKLDGFSKRSKQIIVEGE